MRPICKVTGSHDRTVIFGAVSIDGEQLFRQYETFDGENFLDFLKKVHRKFRHLYLFMDRAKQHYRTRKVRQYIKSNRSTLRIRWIPVGSPAFNVVEECWRQMDLDILALRYDDTLSHLRKRVSEYFRTRRFDLDMRKFLLTNRYG
jgi:transposase